MITVGQLLKKARISKKLSREVLEEKTKIKKEFISAIEEGNWDKLPEYPVVIGFVKNIAASVGVDPQKANAILRRDYPPKEISISPKPDISSKFVWSPKATFAAGIAVVIIFIGGYLGYQYLRFVSPPRLVLNQPAEGALVSSNTVKVEGVVDQDATVTVNNQPVLIDDDGLFITDLSVDSSTQEIMVVAKSRAGKETIVSRKIKVELKE